MKLIGRYFACLLLITLFFLAPSAANRVVKVDTAGVQFGQERPFNWYYPYSYRYYTPHRDYGSRSCYWYYTNGAYVYTCN